MRVTIHFLAGDSINFISHSFSFVPLATPHPLHLDKNTRSNSILITINLKENSMPGHFLYPSIPSPYFTYYHSLARWSLYDWTRTFHPQTPSITWRDHSATFRPSHLWKSVTGYIFDLAGQSCCTRPLEHQHETHKTEKSNTKFVVCWSIETISGAKIKDQTKARAIVALVITEAAHEKLNQDSLCLVVT